MTQAFIAAIECVGALLAGSVIACELRQPYGPIDPVDEAIRLRFLAGGR